MSDTELGALIVYMLVMGFSLFICVLQLIALIFIPVIPWYILAFGQSRYVGIHNN